MLFLLVQPIVEYPLFVVLKNEPARILYEKIGYQEDGLGCTGGIKYSKINLD